MCGIVGYVGNRNGADIVLAGLRALEYRGYDSAGLVTFTSQKTVEAVKRKGNVDELAKVIEKRKLTGATTLGHTRWATHGEPSETNAHPHTDGTGRVFVVHNGIIENHKELRKYLEARGRVFVSETDTECVAHLIAEFISRGADFESALFSALAKIEGSYAFAIIDRENPDTIYAARLSSPLVIGVGEHENFLASDPSALIESTKRVIYLKDREVATITKSRTTTSDLNRRITPMDIKELEWNLEAAQKGNFPHFMLKEIFEGPEVVRTAMRGRLKKNVLKLGGLDLVRDKLDSMRRLIILACGTSYYAGLVGEYIFEEIAGIPTEVHFASEFRYRNEPFEPGTVALAISQSGETADTLAALKKAKEAKLLTLGLVNVVGSSIARETDAGIYNHAGPEVGVASTKAFLSQLTVLTMMALSLAGKKQKINRELMDELQRIPEKIEAVLKQADEIKRLAAKYSSYQNFLFLGRRYNYPVALEGALKLKEISYLHAEGYGAGEMKHGPLAMISPEFPTIAVVPKNSVSEKMYSNIEEIRARKGPVLAIASEGDKKIASIADDVFYIPKTLEPLEPLLAVIPLQLFAYYIGTALGYNVDRPRNLAKSVTVE